MAFKPLAAVDRERLRGYLRKISPLSDDELAPIEAATRVCQLDRGDAFLRAGDGAVECGTILTGVTREFYPLADGREVTRAFGGPGDGVGSLSDLLSGEPSRSTVVAEVDARIAVMAWAVLRDAAARVPAWARFLAQITERLYLFKASREYELLALDAEARYLRFRERYASIEDAIALKQVASYVGVTPEHLSRLRRRLGNSRELAR